MPLLVKGIERFSGENVQTLGASRFRDVLRTSPKEDPYFAAYCASNNITYNHTHVWTTHLDYEQAERSIKKYDKPPGIIEPDTLRRATSFMEQHFQHCNGAFVWDAESTLSSLNLTSSPGFPWNGVFGPDKAMIELDTLEAFWDMYGERSAPTAIWKCSLKVELRDAERVAAGKLRTFTASPVQHAYCLNRLCLAFNLRFYTPHTSSSFVGSSPYMGGWHKLAMRLTRANTHGYELDASAYDASVSRQWLEIVRDFRWDCFQSEHRTDENKVRLWTLYEEIVHSVILMPDGRLIQKHSGNPSGSANTIVDNTLVLYLLLAAAWVKLAPPILRTYSSFSSLVQLALNGDDVLMFVRDEASFYSGLAVAEAIRPWGVNFEPPSPEYAVARPLAELHFLSRGFALCRGDFVPLPDYDKIMCSLAHACKQRDPRYSLLRAINLYLESYHNVPLRIVIEGYIAFLRAEHGSKLVGVLRVKDADIPIDEIFAAYKVHSAVEALYHGYEAGSDSSHVSCLKKIADASMLAPIKNIVSEITDDAKRLVQDVASVDPAKFISDSEKLGGDLLKDGRKAARFAKSALVKMGRDSRTRPGMRQGIEENPGPFKVKGANAKVKIKQRAKVQLARAIVRAEKKVNKGEQKEIKQSGSIGLAYPFRVMQSTARKPFTVSHMEPLGDILGSTSVFELQNATYHLNPGVADTFGWLSTIAHGFEAYKFVSCHFVYVPSCPTTTTGFVAMACNYNPNDDNTIDFSTKVEMMTYDGAMMCNPYQPMELRIRCPNAEGPKLRTVRAGLPVGEYDLHNYDHGEVSLAVGGQASTALVGSLFVKYVVEFYRPRRVANTASGGLYFGRVSSSIPSVSASQILGPSAVLPGEDSNLVLSTALVAVPASPVVVYFGARDAPLNLPGTSWYIGLQIQGTGLVYPTGLMAADVHYTIKDTALATVNSASTLLNAHSVVTFKSAIPSGAAMHLTLNMPTVATTVVSTYLTVIQIPTQGAPGFSYVPPLLKDYKEMFTEQKTISTGKASDSSEEENFVTVRVPRRT